MNKHISLFEFGCEFFGSENYLKLNIDYVKKYYFDVIENLKPGLSQVIIHLGKDEDELREITVDHPNFDYRWRQLDFDIFNSDEFKNHLKKNNIKIITWKDLKKLI